MKEMEKKVEEIALRVFKQYMQSGAFTQRKITDTPTDALSMVNRKYVTMNGTVANRPSASVATVGTRYFATDTGIPMTYTGSNWVNGVGSVVASS